MQRPAHILSCVALVAAAAPSRVVANTWCSTNFPDAVFCDDFDRYCSNAPPEPQECPSESSPNTAMLWTKWIPTGPCSSPLALDSALATSPPWGVKTNTQENSTLAIAKRGFSDFVRAKYGTSYSSMIGTDLNPLVLEFVMQANRARYDNSYLSFGAGYAAAPTDYAWSNFCGCGSTDPRYPVICAQDSPIAACPPSSTWPHVPCIAAGFVSYLDSDPCHCSGSVHSPTNEHLSFYDGFKWYKLRAGLFPNQSGDFLLRPKQNWIKIIIKTFTFRVELRTPETGEYNWCELPRDYMGSFGTFMMGYAVPCQLKTGTWECRGDPYDPTCGVGAPSGSVPYYDNVVVHGGIPFTAPGACCFPNTTCAESMVAGDCASQGGTYAGAGTTCAATACCPPSRADHDMDQDVDVSDFGWFQTCLSSGPYVSPPTVPCQCADLDGDGDVDAADFNVFYNCLTGPAKLSVPGCP